MSNERKVAPATSEVVSSYYQWRWPQPPIEPSRLGVSRKFVGLVSNNWEGHAVRDVMSGAQGAVDVPAMQRIYKHGNILRNEMVGGGLTNGERELYVGLSTALSEWFFNGGWMVQPTKDTHSYNAQGDMEDSRYHRLLLPAHMINFLTKVVENGQIPDVDRSRLIELAKTTHEKAKAYLTDENMQIVASRVKRLGVPESTPRGKASYGIDVHDWFKASGKDVGTLTEKAQEIEAISFDNNMSYFERGPAAGLYFMKSVVISTMQQWHQERVGMNELAPSIEWQESARGHSFYDFQKNSTVMGDMHTNNNRFPFQRYVAYFAEQAA